MKEYVLGFVFDKHHNALFVRKTKPDWQAGRLNGVGGLIELCDTTPWHAMMRECYEETGMLIEADKWRFRITMQGDDWKVHVFTPDFKLDSLEELHGKKTDTDETLCVLPFFNVTYPNDDLIENVSWLVGLCYDEPSYIVTNDIVL